MTATVVLVGAIALGLIHGVEPGHGWPIAAAYALDRPNTFSSGVVSSVLLGLGHLVSSLAVVALFLLADASLDLSRLETPLTLFGYSIGGPLGVVAGALLVVLGVRELRGGHAHAAHHGQTPESGDGCGDRGHDHGHHHHGAGGHAHGHGVEEPAHGHAAVVQSRGHDAGEPSRGDVDGHDHDGDHEAPGTGWRERLRRAGPLGRDDGHAHVEDLDERGLAGLVWAAFVLGFVHEEEFEIVGLCFGAGTCLELMLAYAGAVLVGLVGMTMVLIAGYHRFEERAGELAVRLPTLSGLVLVTMGLGFALGVL